MDDMAPSISCRSGVGRRRSVAERPCAEVIDEEVAADGERKPGLACFDAEEGGVEQAEIGPFFEMNGADLFKNLPFHEQTESAESVDLDPLAFHLPIIF